MKAPVITCFTADWLNYEMRLVAGSVQAETGIANPVKESDGFEDV